MKRVFNFSAGPATLPQQVLEQVQNELLDWHGSGMSVMEMSHRDKEFMSIAQEAEKDLREVLAIPPNYKVLFMQGGATAQFGVAPQNLLRGKAGADYVLTGDWGKKAAKEAGKFGKVNVAASAETSKFTEIPAPATWKLDAAAAYVHITTNETIHGVQFRDIPDTKGVPLVADMSSDFCSRPIDISKFGLVYAGAQKNIGPAGVTVVIVRDDLIGQTLPGTLSVYDYKTVAENESMLNTPPCFAWYVCGLVFKWIKANGGLAGVGQRNERKAKLLYDYIDSQGFYKNPVKKENRSIMNVPFTVPNAEMDADFLKGAKERQLLGLKGHRSVGGMRASLYNAMSEDGVKALVEYMQEFAKGKELNMFKIQTLNNISVLGLERLPRDRYEIASEIQNPDALMVRSADMHKIDIAKSVKAIGRAGAGTNNIPVAAMSKRGVPVFNAPGANANAVKELVIAGMLLAARNLAPALDFVKKLDGDDKSMHEAVESGKKKFVGFELPGRTLGVIGLGAIGVKVANAALELGMSVYGYDPAMTVQNAWQLNSGVKQALSVDDLMSKSQLISVHVPLLDATRGLVNAERIKLMKKPGVVLNFARAEIVDEVAVVAALASGQLQAYVCDFPSPALKGNPKVIATPHLGASTGEAEDNCAMMVADQLREFLEIGTIRNSVNFPEAQLPLLPGKTRLCIVNENVPNMVGQISTALAKRSLNIADLLNKSRGDLAYTLVDIDQPAPAETIKEICAIHGVLSVREIGARD